MAKSKGNTAGPTVVIDATVAGGRRAERHGVYRYVAQLVRALSRLGDGCLVKAWFNAFRSSGRDGVGDFMNELPHPTVTSVVSRFPGRMMNGLGLPAEWLTGPCDVFHSPNHLLPPLRRTPGVVTIHDLAFLRMQEDLHGLNPDWAAAIGRRSARPADDLAAYRARCDFFLNLRAGIHRTVHRADCLVAVSNATAADLESITRVPRERIRVVPNGLTPRLSPVRDVASTDAMKEQLGLRRPFVLYVGVLDPNKSLHTLIRAFARASPPFRQEHELVIAGPRNWFQCVLEEEADRLGLGKQVRFTGFVPEPLLPALYSSATAVVAPSALEGFGFTVLEAMACGTPVVVADAGALPEVAGEDAVYVPPEDPEALAQQIERIANDSELAEALSQRGLTRCMEFSWDRTARLMVQVYREVAA